MGILAQEQISLEQAIATGLARNFDIRIEKKNIEVSQNNNAWGEAGRWPTIDFNFRQNNLLNNNIEASSPFAPQGTTLNSNFTPELALNWTLFNGFKVNMNKSRLEELQAQTEGNADIVISNTIQAIILGYYKVVLENRRLEELGKQLKLSSDKYAYIKVKTEIGSAVTTDLLLEESNYLTDSTNLINQELVFRRALRDFNVLMAESNPDKNYVFEDPLEFEFVPYKLGDLTDKMLNKNVDLKKQYITQSILNYDKRMRRADQYPSLNFAAGANTTSGRVDYSKAEFFNQGDGTFSPGPSDPLKSLSANYFANFTISFTLFNGKKINRAIQNAVIQEDIGNVRIEKMETSLTRDLYQAYDEYLIKHQLLGINKRKHESTKTNLELSTEKYRNGTINSFDFRTVQNNQLLAAIAHLQSMYNLMDAHVQLMRLTGGIIESYK